MFEQNGLLGSIPSIFSKVETGAISENESCLVVGQLYLACNYVKSSITLWMASPND